MSAPGRPRSAGAALGRELPGVGLGAIAGALLRWQLGWDPLANLLGCLLIGWLAGQKPPRPGWFLVLGVGFCGSLTTFGGWVLALADALGTGAAGDLALRLGELLAGVAAVAVGRRLARLGSRRQGELRH